MSALGGKRTFGFDVRYDRDADLRASDGSMLCSFGEPCEQRGMIQRACLTLALLVGLVAPSEAQNARPTYDFRERTRELAFDPARFFPRPSSLALSVRFMGDDYGFPVYALAVHRGCLVTDRNEERQGCSGRLRARMVRPPYKGEPPRARARGQRLFARIARAKPQSDDALRLLLDNGGLEWLEADIRKCPTALAHLATGGSLKFSLLLDDISRLQEPGLHSDYMTVEVGSYLERSQYKGWPKPGTPGGWVNEFAASLEACWKPTTALAPWRAIDG